MSTPTMPRLAVQRLLVCALVPASFDEGVYHTHLTGMEIDHDRDDGSQHMRSIIALACTGAKSAPTPRGPLIPAVLRPHHFSPDAHGGS